MLTLRIEEKIYKKGTNWSEFSYDEAKALIGSEDPDGESLPVEEKDPGKYFFTKGCPIRLYYVGCDKQNKDDFLRLELLIEIRQNDADELRYWFKKEPIGLFMFETRIYKNRDDDWMIEFGKLSLIEKSTEQAEREADLK